ncbi:DMSO/TMAO reductase YedYZ, molybdopterin-dependent catalytic subunit [Halogranum gelatinilyticum]|uniref:DMSO/TMAO reductase YedYZ, molybdopterin-dependent catalytic subunit n=1 Tax=Halogranum gelatinilyticum TaxID=660521 RepID=A0A1G9Y0Q7_9EURY|nr:molybdopterin-dependent oxidoreductase [Halogranum gelatinilyticum]SDN02025.1 DMSO/TMAO reductase YedYZ, molybdopterin-dependent catalytic subunit [Halogranum gelatinilyticum]
MSSPPTDPADTSPEPSDATPSHSWPARILVALLAGVAGVAGSFAVASFTPAFVAGPIAGFLARRLPGAVITFAIVVLGDFGDQLNVLTALGIATLLFAGATLVGQRADRALGGTVSGPVVAAAVLAVAYAVTGAPLPSLAAGVAAGLVAAVADLVAVRGFPAIDGDAAQPGRRRVLAAIASALPLVLGGYALGARADSQSASSASSTLDVGEPWAVPEVDAMLAQASEQSLAVAGLEPLVSDSFYQVDINSTDPALDAADWSLSVTGAVDEEVTYSYEEIARMEMEHRFVSLRCVGEPLNGRKLDNAVWTGVSIMDLVEPAGVDDGCCVMFRAADGFYEEFPLSALRDGFLAIGMNGQILPRGHGYPARALIPGHWGEINVKWIDEIEILDRPADGYWEKRGWHGTGPVNTVAKLWVDNRLDDGRIEVAGHAYAGTRDVERVEVSTDGGATWADAELSERLPGTDVWRQWVYRYEPPGGEHEVVVRATDGTGTLQPEDEASAFPNGASGWVSKTLRP